MENDASDTRLVIARARALEGLNDYNLFKRNCENFAMFCESGIDSNLQFAWLMFKINDTFTSTLLRMMKMVALLPVISKVSFSLFYFIFKEHFV